MSARRAARNSSSKAVEVKSPVISRWSGEIPWMRSTRAGMLSIRKFQARFRKRLLMPRRRFPNNCLGFSVMCQKCRSEIWTTRIRPPDDFNSSSLRVLHSPLKPEGRRQKAESGRQKAGGRRRKAEGGRQEAGGCLLLSAFRLLLSAFRSCEGEAQAGAAAGL